MVVGVNQSGLAARSHRTEAVTRAIEAMKAELGAPQPLAALARRGMFSPFHFHRIFRETTAMTPASFLAALRMAEARRLLAHSSMPITKISARVGYTSPGTFTTRFGSLVGVSPTGFREMARSFGNEVLSARLPALRRAGQPGGTTVALSGAPGSESLVVGWLFPVGHQRNRPGRWALTAGHRTVHLPEASAPGVYTAFSVVVPAHVRLVDALVDQRPDSYLVGAGRLSLRNGQPEDTGACLGLRRPRPTDPPLLAITPLRWLLEHHGRPGTARYELSARTK